MALPESRIYFFMDQERSFSLYFLEGQKLIQDLALIHNLKGQGFEYFRDSILTCQMMISYLKNGETLGLYIDSTEPYFRLKIEMGENGLMRTLLHPANFNKFPAKLTGQCRLTKISPVSVQPYTSIIDLENIDFHEVVNQVFQDSYQVRSKVIVSNHADQSFMISKLPVKITKHIQHEEERSLEDFEKYYAPSILNFMEKAPVDQDVIKSFFGSLGFIFLKSQEIRFKCSCNRERMIAGIMALAHNHVLDEIFDGKDKLEAKCDYCNTFYEISHDEVKKNLNNMH